ncbi:MAG: outer membrane chaperone Skp [Candidatus Desulfovibrio kirbyi]|uniref:Outer membrane chaperone Skp n=1 Tax=Candidatus Desulfovibrio kirbyi TaxID=2696086 RepID=A0A6L2R603_9BACT|nr:MAG: outer membrane chaperone Skp [Candidatus Desulfovibrio kirbyi]
MRFRHFWPVVLILLVPVHVASSAVRVSGNPLVVVDMERVQRETKAGKAATAHLEAVRQRLQQGMDEFQKSVKNESEPRRAEMVTNAKLQLEQHLKLYKTAAWGLVNTDILRETGTWQKARPGTLVIARQILLAADEMLDITPDIITAMDAADVPTFAELPVVNIAPAVCAPGKKPAAKQPPPKKGQAMPDVR